MTSIGPIEREASGTLVIRQGLVVYATAGVGVLAGRPAAGLVGARYLDLIAPEDRARVADRHDRRVRGEPVPSEYETSIVMPDGGRRVVELRVDRDGDDVLVRLRDVSAQAARRPRLAALAALGAAIQREQSEADVFARVREGLWDLGLTSVLLRAEAESVRIEWARAPEAVEAAAQTHLGRGLAGFRGRWSAFARAAWDDGAAYSDDWGAEAAQVLPDDLAENARAMAVVLGLSHAIAVRLDERAAVRFYLVVTGDWLQVDDVAALRLFGAQVAAALDASRIIADLSRRNAELAALNRLGELVGEMGDLDAFFRRAAEVLRDAAGTTGLAVYVLDERAAELVCVFHVGAVPEARERFERIPLGGPFGAVVRDRLARVVDAHAGDPGSETLRACGYDASAWVPLVARSRAVGVMAAGFGEGPERVRSRLDVLTAAAAHFASAVESHGLLSDLRRRVGELMLLNDLALASAQLDPVLLLDSALRRISETLAADLAAAYLRDGERLLLVAGVGMAPASARSIAQLPVGEGAPGLAVQRLAPVVADQIVQLGGRCAELVAAESVGPAAAVPLLAKSHALGAILFGRRTARPFEESEVALLSAIGVQLGVAVENARLFADVRRRLSDLEAVHALALRIFGNAPGDVRALLEDGCRESARALSCRGAVVLLLDEDGRTLRGIAGFGAPVAPEKLTLVLDEDGLATEAFRRRAPAWTEDATRDPRSTLSRIPGIPPLAMLAVPLTSRAATRGVLFIADDAGRTFTDPELALANALAGELAVGLENAELYAEARRRVEELSLLNEMGRTVAASLDVDRVLREGVEAARRLLDASRGYVVLYEPFLSELRVAAGTGLSAKDLADSRAALREGGISARVIRERRAIVVEDVAAEPEVNAEFRRRLAPRSLIAAPLLLRGEPLGVLVVDEARRLRRFSEADVERVTAVANQLAVAIENARLYAEARGRLSELSTVIDVARVVSSSLEHEEVLGAGAEHLKRTLQGSACTILLGDARAHHLRRAASRGLPIGEELVPLDRPSLARDALEARAPVAGPLAPGPDGAADALLAVPLHVRDQPVGVALVARADPERAFTPGELSRAMAIASQLAIAVDNARLYSETRRRAEELALLHEVGRSLVATLEIEQVLDAGVRNLARIVDCPEAYLALATEDGEHLEVRAVTAALQGALGLRLPARGADGTLGSIVFERRAPVAVEDAAADPRARREPLPAGGAARACLGLPLLVRDRTIGSAVIVDTRGPRRFTPAEVERAAAIANQLAVAAENARLYEDLRKSYAELARAQRQLIQQERLAALGELSAVVAHEVRNPLGVIFNSLGSLRRMLKPSGDAKMLLDIVGEEADRLNRIVGDLLDFAHPSMPQLRPEQLERVVDEAVHAAVSQNASGVELAREADPDLPAVPMDARLVRQAVLNVAVNAVQAMPRGGRLTIRLRRSRGGVLLEIEDTGAGIPEEVRHRIFEPFFTTKASGTGLGLAVVKRIVDGHGGEIAVSSRPGAGTTFSLHFPLAPLLPGDLEGGGLA